MNKPELLAPAGDMEKLEQALFYGADAVYVGGKEFNLRAKAKNFSIEELAKAVDFVHAQHKKIYLTLNIFAHNQDISLINSYLQEIKNLKIDGIIAADPGVISMVQTMLPETDIHVSTQANTTNYASVKFWKSLGVRRIVLARELSFKEIEEIAIKNQGDIELECFVHGSLCISYSGRCLLSNYMTNRDANQGHCVQACRFQYALVEQKRENEYFPIVEDERGSYIMNSKDLCMIEHIPHFFALSIHSLKIEGRIKSSYYIATVIKAYREAIDDYASDPTRYEEKKKEYLKELKKTSHRIFDSGFYFHQPTADGQIYDSNSYNRTHEVVALVLDYDPARKMAYIEQRNKFSLHDELEVMKQTGPDAKFIVSSIVDETGLSRESAPHPQEKLWISIGFPVQKHEMIRKKISKENI